ncbi:MAG: acetyl-CoA decarbonylase/synthase complex subunit gamma [Deltaproteobacteria bacterium]|nr:MAG: acetyl-CoA decarbonylase/synthase complex subunit gamma [Deltaproteobacteria bacterium]
MGLTGIQIFQLLPKTNCKECGVPTCLAFAMNLAAGKAELSQCPYVSEEAKQKLAAESAPPIRTVEIGTGDGAFKVGGETVLFRHEKTFFNPTGLAVLVSDDEDEASIDGKLERFNDLVYERVGLILKSNAVAVKASSGDQGKFVNLVKKVVEKTDRGIILMTENAELMTAAVEVAAARKPLLYAATADNADAMGKLAKEKKLPLAVKAEGLEALAELTKKLNDAGVEDLVIDPGSRQILAALQDEIRIRESAVQKKFRQLGFPTIVLPFEMTDDFMLENLYAALLLAKYAGIIVLSDFQGENLFPLLLERLNIYTDPQRPMKTEQKIYEINNPGPDSPVLCTSNFSLTYFIVSGEIENSRVPSYLAVLDTEGLSVLTAWAAGKFVGDLLGSFINKSGIKDKLQKRNIIIPGYAAVIQGDLEEEVGSDWQVHVGPREAANIPAFLREKFAG